MAAKSFAMPEASSPGFSRTTRCRSSRPKCPPPSDLLNDRALDAAMKYVNAQGVTTIHNMGTWNELEVMARAWKDRRATTRMYAVVPLDTWDRLRQTVSARTYGSEGRGDEWFRVGGLKGFVDGSLGSHTAAFHEPFTDAPKDRGLFVNTPENLYTWISNADKAALHVIVHAIGDRANSTLLDIYERVARENGARDRRFRIEHAQHLAPADIPRFKTLDVIASMQPYHAIDDGRWADRVIGPERSKTTYAFRSLLDAGARLAFGSDWFVAPPTPLEGIYAAVTSRTLDGGHPGGWVPEQKIRVDEALAAYTSGARLRLVRGVAEGHDRARHAGGSGGDRSGHSRDPARADSRREGDADDRRREDGLP